jgi:hypothetical protein
MMKRVFQLISSCYRLIVASKERIAFTQQLVDVCMKCLKALCDVELYTYQAEVAERVFFSLIVEDNEEITVLSARQSGKSEALACTVATAMVILPILAKMYPDDPVVSKFKAGIYIGVFGPVDFMADNIFSRIKLRLSSEKAKAFLSAPDIGEEEYGTTTIIHMRKSRSFCRKQTAHPQAKVESSTYHLVVVDEAQDADATTVRKSIHPMLVATAGTIVKTGTSTSHISDFYEAINRNKRRPKTNGRKNHLEFDWHRAARENKRYAKSIEREKQRLGEDSDEFNMSFNLRWLLDRGMFVTDEQAARLGDRSMEALPYYFDSPVVIGLDVAAKHDSTVATALFVDWEHPDEFGLYHHVILDWLELHGENWESQYAQICDFAGRFSVARMGVDAQGMGEPVAARLGVLLPNIEVVPLPMNPIDQSERWRHLLQLLQRERIRWPAGDRTKRTRGYQRFIQQITEVEKEYKGKYIVVEAPRNDKNAHDDYVDSLALGCWMTHQFGQVHEVVEWTNNPLLERSTARSR